VRIKINEGKSGMINLNHSKVSQYKLNKAPRKNKVAYIFQQECVGGGGAAA
jgi:hypothetical protein